MKNVQSLVYYAETITSHIPTRGLPCSVLDMYRTAKLIKEKNDFINSGIVFHENYNDIGVFENEIASIDDLLKFETMLRFVLLKDHISVVEPSVRYSVVNNGSQLDSYSRIPKYALESADKVFQKANAFNNIFPIEKVLIENGKVIKSTNPNSIYLNLQQSEIENKILSDSLSNDFLHTLPQSLSIPFVYNEAKQSDSHNTIFNEFLNSLDDEYVKSTEYSVKLGYNIQLPFFTNTVLSMAKNRDHIPEAILELRAILEPLRNKLFKYEIDFRSTSGTRDQAILQKDVKQAIKTYTEKIYDPGNLLSDTVQLIVSLISNPNEYLGKIFNPQYSIGNEFPVLFGNSNYKMMKRLISKDNLNTNIEWFLNEKEMKNIQLK